jgi:hypothetical protein
MSGRQGLDAQAERGQASQSGSAASVHVDWSIFLRAMADEIDTLGGGAARDALLRSVGARMAAMRPLSSAPNMETLAMEINDQLALMGWGQVGFVLSERDRSLLITHSQLPRIGAAGDPPGTWLSALLEGLYQGWLGQLPGSDQTLAVRRMRITPQAILLRYGKPTI